MYLPNDTIYERKRQSKEHKYYRLLSTDVYVLYHSKTVVLHIK